MKDIKYRSELKHIITLGDAAVVRNRLAMVLPADENAGPDRRYHVRSLYFDTPEDRSLFEKIESLPFREKFRIRFYNHDHSFIRLEKKIKHYGKSAKSGAGLKKEEVQAILRGDILFLIDAGQALLREFYLKLKTERLIPRTVVDYMREAYSYPAGNVRVTIDSDVRASISSTDLFDADLPCAAVLETGLCVLEVKYDGFLPEFIQDLIQLNKCTSTAISKYAACRLYM
ncbi:polyphosphate polymerase domain-containing protein [Moorella sulfitireducens (nom. illeg.)]|uniref:polyphosphate polymerase domain-containing protein n=1 Tax=Neomoorella sulfitireducens TaxID=2972948 RepID=UPI0021AC94BC|nr:polyphosphate polymerase domain-containing protein [Moorella sulfitireducens]